MVAAPNVSLFSMSSISDSAPLGVCLRKKTLGSVVTMCRCFDCGRYAANARTVTTCVHQDQKKTTADDSPANTELRKMAPAIGGGVKPFSRFPAASPAPSKRSSVIIRSEEHTSELQS